ncbi:MAG: diacylglyceryl transferase, partial [Sphingobacteriia bacterium]
LLLLRKKLRIPGQMAAVYLVLNGLERFFIEKIRVNTQYDLPFQPTQAELISLGLMAAGVLLWIMVKRHPLALPKKP